MKGSELYPALPAATVAPSAASDLAERVAELERVVATLAVLRRDRLASDRPDPVALTNALHPGGMRGARAAKRRTSGNGSSGTIGVRFMLFDQPAR
jgi:hypothetical protein